MKPFAAVFLATCACFAQTSTTSAPTPAQVLAHGEGIVSAKPDQVRIHIGVTTQDAAAQAASAANAKQTTAVIAQLKQQLGVAAADIRTMNYSLHPNYKHNRDGSNPTIAGYQANNTVEVRLNDVSLAGKAIDVATQSGANQIQGVMFSMKDEQKLRGEALAIAAAQARANAQALASAVGLRMVRIVRIQDGEPVQVINVRAEMMSMAKDAVQSTPVEAGQVQVRATVTITAEVAP
jgi:uncharacterized protein YggE